MSSIPDLTFVVPGNNWDGFPFLFALCTAASLIIWFAVDVKKGRRDAVAFADSKRAEGSTRTDSVDEDLDKKA
jgi:hypothetical protein